ncbi:MAG TPA: hypothetical protein VHK27_05615 [Gammaproteobacteria bacterium]|nr:hypothetical protein [Gammaproteobacteria bacterium]
MKLLTPFVAEPIDRPQKSIETEEEILAKKERFAELLLRENEPFKVALVLYPDDTGRALRIAHEWPTDPQVKAFQQSAIDAEGEITFLPTKADAARLAWNMARDEGKFTEDRLKALKLYAEIRGFIEKPAVNVSQTNNTLVQNNVMVVRDHGSDEEWSEKLRNQQKRLKADVIEHARDGTN